MVTTSIEYATPSFPFLMFGVIWLFHSFWLHLTTKYSINQGSTHSKESLQRKSYIPLFCCPGIPLEPLLLKIVLPIVMIILDCINAYHSIKRDKSDFWSLRAPERITIYGFFLLSGFIDLVSFYVKYPKLTPQIFTTIAFAFVSFLVYFDAGKFKLLEQTGHLIFSYVVMATTLFSGLRLLSASNLWINAGFSLSLILQGSWLAQMVYILYGPTDWDKTSRDNEVLMATLFVWHAMAALLFALFLYIVLLLVVSLRAKGLDRVYLENGGSQSDKIREEIAMTEVDKTS